MLYQRIITAVILLIIVVAALWISPLAFTGVAAIAIACCFWEWLRICRWNSAFAGLCAVVLGGLLFWLEWDRPQYAMDLLQGNWLILITGLATIIWTAITAVIFTRRTTGWQVPHWLGSVLAWLLMPSAWFALMYFYRTYGAVYMLSVLAIVWVADIMAYFGGMLFHGPKMAVGISPKKTWAGAITAFISCLIIAYLVFHFSSKAPLWTNYAIENLNLFSSLLLIFVVVLFSISGDLFESAIKRTAGVKDSSNLLPGHGGFYDRLDAQISVLPLCAFAQLFIQGF